MPMKLTVSQVLQSGELAVAAGIVAEARHREKVRKLLAESRYLRTHFPTAHGEELRASIEVMLRRVDQAGETHRRHNATIARLQDLLRRARRHREQPDRELDVAPNLFEVLSPFLEPGHVSDCRSAEEHLRRAVRSRTITRDGIVGHLKALCATPCRGF
jgi:DNA-binding response OmpR family regulator